MADTQRRGADLIADALKQAGVETIFSLSGNQIMPIYDALLDTGIRIVHTRHEGGAVYMADGYAQATGRVGIALLTAGPGFANGLSAMYSAKVAESAVVIITGDSSLAQDGSGAFQEMDQVTAATPMTKASLRATDTGRLGETIRDAMALAASGRPGPVHVAIPFDVVEAKVTQSAAASKPATPAAARADDVAAAWKTLASASQPLIVTGPALCRASARRSLEALTAATGAPVVTMESPRGLRDPRLGAFAEVLAKADAVISLGKPFDFLVGFGKAPALSAEARIVQVDPDEGVLARDKARAGSRLAGSFVADPLAFAEALAKVAMAAQPAKANAWRGEVAEAIAFRPPSWGNAESKPDRIHPVHMAGAVRDLVDKQPETIVVVDGGEIGQWCQAIVGSDLRIINGPSGAIGGGIGYAIGAKAAHPERPVILMMGDGTAGFHFMELETAAREGLAIVAIIGNDKRWNAEHQIQLREYGDKRTFACELSEARYDQAAIALGCHGEQVTEASALPAALAHALASGKPACLNVMIEGLPAPAVKRG